MTSEVLARADRALETEDLLKVLARHVGDGAVLGHRLEYDTFTLHIAPGRWVDVVAALRDEPLLSFDLFDSLFGVDDRDDGFRVVCVLYSTAMGVRVLLDVKVPGGREAPALGTLTGLYAGANWMERETWDMFGIEFEGHPGLAPRILNVENFEGWPLRKDFFLASRVAKPWPGVKEPAETDEEGNVIERETGLGDASGPTDLDKAMADHAKAVNVAAAPEAREEIEEPAAEEPMEEPEARAEPEAPAEEPVEEVAEEPVEEAAEEPEEDPVEEVADEPVEEVADEPAAEEPAATPTAEETRAEASSRGDDVYEGELPDEPAGDDPSSAERDGWAE